MKVLGALGLVLFLTSYGCSVFHKTKLNPIDVGEINLKQLSHYKWYSKGYRKYHVNKKTLADLQIKEPVRVLVFGGNWCSDTKIQLPRFMKVLKYLKIPDQSVRIVFLNEEKKCEECLTYSVEAYNILKVPTFIFLTPENLEKGRIVETPTESLEEDIRNIINLQ